MLKSTMYKGLANTNYEYPRASVQQSAVQGTFGSKF